MLLQPGNVSDFTAGPFFNAPCILLYTLEAVQSLRAGRFKKQANVLQERRLVSFQGEYIVAFFSDIFFRELLSRGSLYYLKRYRLL